MPPLKSLQQSIEVEIKKQKYGKQPDSLYEPIRYLMSLGGKRIRPMLTLLSYSLFKSDVKRIIPLAVAIEAFHNFTLMHDDIMDKAPLRRGKPTVHKKWNVSTAILSGDVMLVKVYDMFLSLDPPKLKEVLMLFNKCAAEVCEGQQWDMEFETRSKVTEADYINMIRLKTAVLVGFSMELGAVIAGAPESDQKALRTFGTNIGVGFQLKDDLLDAYGDPKKFGKQVGGDIISNKKTFLLIQALQRAKGKTKKELTNWLNAPKFNKSEKVQAVKNIYDHLGVREEAEKKITAFFQKGFKAFDNVQGDASAKETLRRYTQELIARES